MQAIYSQVMDIQGEIPAELQQLGLESRLANGASVRECIRALVSSDFYSQRYYQPYPNAKVVELLFRHLLGRKPTMTELSQFEPLECGLQPVVDSLLNGAEYVRYFGDNVVPYRREL